MIPKLFVIDTYYPWPSHESYKNVEKIEDGNLIDLKNAAIMFTNIDKAAYGKLTNTFCSQMRYHNAGPNRTLKQFISEIEQLIKVSVSNSFQSEVYFDKVNVNHVFWQANKNISNKIINYTKIKPMNNLVVDLSSQVCIHYIEHV